MKLYSMNFDWAGGLVVVANNKHEALYHFVDKVPSGFTIDESYIEEHEIVPGTLIVFLGDR